MKLYEIYSQFDTPTVVLISLAIVLAGGFLLSRVTKLLHLPNVTGYILAGVLMGPCVFGVIPPDIITGMEFVSDVALAFISFGVGKFFKVERLKRTGWKVIVITLMQSLLAGLLVTFTVKLCFGFSWDFSVLLGSIAMATAPTSTMMTIHQYHARGDFVDILLQVIALDNVICLFVFSIVTGIMGAEAIGFVDVAMPVLYNLGAIALGVVCGFITGPMIRHRKQDNRLIIVTAVLIAIAGVCSMLGVSPLLACMVYGAVYINFTKDKELYHQINHIMPPIMTIFFVLSGLKLDLNSLAAVGAVGIVYVAVRIVGKLGGSYLGNLITRQPPVIRKHLGFALIPSAGVAIGLAFLAQRMLPEETGNLLMTIVLSSSVLYELIGPVSARIALFRSGCIKPYTPEPETENVIADSVPVRLETADTAKTSPLTSTVVESAAANAAVTDVAVDNTNMSDFNSVSQNAAQSAEKSAKDDRHEGAIGIATLFCNNNFKK